MEEVPSARGLHSSLHSLSYSVRPLFSPLVGASQCSYKPSLCKPLVLRNYRFSPLTCEADDFSVVQSIDPKWTPPLKWTPPDRSGNFPKFTLVGIPRSNFLLFILPVVPLRYVFYFTVCHFV